MTQVKFVDLTLRDGQQSLAATRMTTAQALSVLSIIRDAGYAAMELWGGATLDSCVRYLDEDPWERLDAFSRCLGAPAKLRVLLRGQNLFAYQPYPDDLVIAFVKEAVRSGAGLMRIFDALNDWRNLQMALIATKAYGGKVETALSYTVSPIHTTGYFVDLALKLQEEGADQIAIKDMAGLLRPEDAVELFRRLKDAVQVPITFHSHTTTGVATLNAVLAMQAGIDAIDTAITPFAGGASHPPIEILIVFAEELGMDHGLDKEAILKAQARLFEIFNELKAHISPNHRRYRPVSYSDIDRRQVERILDRLETPSTDGLPEALSLMRALLRSLGYPPHDEKIFKAQIPGGMLSNLESQLRQMGQIDKMDQIMTEVPRVRADVGYVPLVTPTSQIIGSQATFNVMLGRYQMVSNEFKMLLRGEFGMTPAPPDPDVLRLALGPGEEPLSYRPASYLHPVLEDNHNAPFIKSHRDLLLHLMLKQPADEFLKRKHGQLA
ncbi:MAG: oxaloacetate decarboxylase subunit alpha [Anaerolineae bacterium]